MIGVLRVVRRSGAEHPAARATIPPRQRRARWS
jgi:hypothetical protein